ncbi:hypothetical protein GCM10018783_74140 [Streptomyces griseosporeus]|nr:hypothetical protein GCM10018783_74140 [Streptomyces griseosporeus]
MGRGKHRKPKSRSEKRSGERVISIVPFGRKVFSRVFVLVAFLLGACMIGFAVRDVHVEITMEP